MLWYVMLVIAFFRQPHRNYAVEKEKGVVLKPNINLLHRNISPEVT